MYIEKQREWGLWSLEKSHRTIWLLLHNGNLYSQTNIETQCKDKRQYTQGATWENTSREYEKYFQNKSDQALEQVAQADCGKSILSDF